MDADLSSDADQQRILLVDDHLPWTSVLQEVICHIDPGRFIVSCAHSGAEALEHMRRETFDLVFLDLNMGDTNGIEVLRRAGNDKLARNYVLMSAENEVRNAVEALKLGASDFLVKPFGKTQVQGVLDRLLPAPSRAQEASNLSQAWRETYAPEIIGNHPSVLNMLLIIERVAQSNASVLITGEAGTGKELVARAVHNASDRAKGPLLPINVTATGESLFESSLFGWAKGAFTGASTDHAGFFEDADKGTIFLDEIGELPLHQQPKLLRVLECGTFHRIGESKLRKTNARVVAATNQNLEDQVHAGKFRADLYWRLNIIPIRVPPLRERASDIPLLTSYFLGKMVKAQGRDPLKLTEQAQAWLVAQPWPGNIRELEHSLRRVCLLHRDSDCLDVPDLERYLRFEMTQRNTVPGSAPSPTEPSAPPLDAPRVQESSTPAVAPATLDVDELVARVTLPESGLNLRELQDKLTTKLIWEALVASEFVRAKAASSLGLQRTTLVEKIRRLSKHFPRLNQAKPMPGDDKATLDDLRSGPASVPKPAA